MHALEYINILRNSALQYFNQLLIHKNIIFHQTFNLFHEIYHNIPTEKISDSILQYMSEHPDIVTLKDIAARYGYHPNYISTLLRKETGRSFSEILLSQRMDRAIILVKSTNLSISEISLMLGYSNNNNFYKAFREYYHISPREYFQKR